MCCYCSLLVVVVTLGCREDTARFRAVMLDLHATLMGALREFDIVFPESEVISSLKALLGAISSLWPLWAMFHPSETLQKVYAWGSWWRCSFAAL